MAGLQTQETNESVDELIEAIAHDGKREDAKALLAMMTEATQEEPKVWGDQGIIGFGKYSYTRKGGKEEFEWFRTGFAARKAKITVYLTFDIAQEEELLSQLGKFKHGRGCLYLNKLADVDLAVLKQLVKKSRGW